MGFDIDKYTARTKRLCWDDLDLSAFSRQPLGEEVLGCLRYMHDVEFHTACYLRDLLVTPAHADPEVTAFLAMWAYEEYWHGEALAAVLEVHGDTAGASRVATLRAGLGWRDRLRPLVMTLAGWADGSRLVALQMAWGMLNESLTQAGYQLLAERAEHPVLAELLERIVRQEALHLGFYSSQARARLEGDGATQRFVRRWLSRLWQPVGSGLMPPAETEALYGYLLKGSGAAERCRRMDRRLASLPGLAGLDLVTKALGKYLEPAGSAPQAGAGVPLLSLAG